MVLFSIPLLLMSLIVLIGYFLLGLGLVGYELLPHIKGFISSQPWWVWPPLIAIAFLGFFLELVKSVDNKSNI